MATVDHIADRRISPHRLGARMGQAAIEILAEKGPLTTPSLPFISASKRSWLLSAHLLRKLPVRTRQHSGHNPIEGRYCAGSGHRLQFDPSLQSE